ncbi:MAG: DUF5915 domain-containing protein, partial [Nocardioidaceae bacterium]
APSSSASVHLATWPSGDEALVDPQLGRGRALTRRLVDLVRSARAEGRVKARQPLQRALIPSSAFGQLTEGLRAEIAAELNVETVESLGSTGDLVDHTAKANFRNLGKRFGSQTPHVAAAIAAADAASLAERLVRQGSATIDFEGGVEITADDVIISERPREGWSVVNEHGETVALDLHLTPELIRAGRAREVIRTMQEARKTHGLDVSDRISLSWQAEGETAGALRQHADVIAREILAVEVREEAGDHSQHDSDLGLAFTLRKV